MYKFEKEAHICFFDFSQAYDSICRDKLWWILKEFEIPTKLIQLIKECNINNACKVKCRNQLLESFEVNTGLRQGDTLSLIHFNLALDKFVMTMPACHGRENTIADDIVVIGNTWAEVFAKTDDLIKTAKSMCLKINQTK